MGIAERKNRQKQALRERILDAARRIVMREGFAALSMRKIADAIEYSPATLYLHFASRDEIAQALCAEGYAQLLETFVPLMGIVDPAERLKAMGRAYVAFGVAHPETYRLIFMEDPSYTGAALGGAALASGAGNAATTSEDDPGAAALQIMISALDELKAAGRLSASMDVNLWAEAFWATLHGIVALNLTCPVFPTAPLDTVVALALDAWLGAPQAAPQSARRPGQPRGAAGAVARVIGAGQDQTADARTASIAAPSIAPASKPGIKSGGKSGIKPPASSSRSKPTNAPAKKTSGPAVRRKPVST